MGKERDLDLMGPYIRAISTKARLMATGHCMGQDGITVISKGEFREC